MLCDGKTKKVTLVIDLEPETVLATTTEVAMFAASGIPCCKPKSRLEL